VTQLVEEEQGGLSDRPLQNILVYLNRLSDYLFVVARYANKAEGTTDQVWQQP